MTCHVTQYIICLSTAFERYELRICTISLIRFAILVYLKSIILQRFVCQFFRLRHGFVCWVFVCDVMCVAFSPRHRFSCFYLCSTITPVMGLLLIELSIPRRGSRGNERAAGLHHCRNSRFASFSGNTWFGCPLRRWRSLLFSPISPAWFARDFT